MKAILTATLILLIVTTIYGELQVPVNLPTPVNCNTVMKRTPQTRNPAPEFNFHTEPIGLSNTFYDYFPGGFYNSPLRLQPSPVGFFEGGGLYLTYQASLQAGGARRVYYGYAINGELTGSGLVNTPAPLNRSEGFPAIDMDYDTGNPLFSWHSQSSDNPNNLNGYFTYDQYEAIGFPGLLNQAYEVVRNPYQVGDEHDNQFIWPTVHIGPSPNEGQKRIYIVARNSSPNNDNLPAENALISYADFTDITDLEVYNANQWTRITIPQMNEWRQNNIRPFFSMVAMRNRGTIALVGHTMSTTTAVPYPQTERLFVLENSNYGDGEWQLYTADPTVRVSNPRNPVTGGGYFINEFDAPYQDMRYKPFSSRFDVTVDENGNYHFVAVYFLSTEENTWYPQMTTSKHIKFDRGTREFFINDLYPSNPLGGTYLPWGDPPEFDEFGHLAVRHSYPCYWWDSLNLFQENYHRIISDGPNMVIILQESSKANFFHRYNVEQYASWANAPETYIFLSRDYGTSWSSPIIMNANPQDDEPDEVGIFHGNYTPELQGMIPAYWYPADTIEMLNDSWGRLHLMFLDQNNYGSSVIGNGPATGGTIRYTSIDVCFEEGQFPYPKTAANPIPVNDTTGVSIELESLRWEYEADTLYVDPVGFRVYFSESPQFEDDDFEWIAYNEEQTEYNSTTILPDELDYYTDYYWTVVPTTDEPERRGDAPQCPIWTFKTEPYPYPAIAEDPVPVDEATNVPLGIERLKWEYSAVSSNVNPVGFRVYFNKSGEFDDEEFVWVDFSEEQEEYNSSDVLPELLDYRTTYYWTVVPTATFPDEEEWKDAAQPPVWSFKTELSPHPMTAVNPVPANDTTDVSIYLEKLRWSYYADSVYVNPIGFRVYFNNEDDFSNNEYIWIDFNEQQEDYFCDEILPESLQPETTYYWKVVPTTNETERRGEYHSPARKRSERDGRMIFAPARGDAEDVQVWSFTTINTTDVEAINELPVLTKLNRNYPNPFNPETTISFSLAETSDVIIEIFNNRGQKVVTLVDNNYNAGNHQVIWNGRDSNGNPVGSGIYLYRMKTNDYEKVNKAILLK